MTIFHCVNGLQVGSSLQACKLTELDYSAAFLGVLCVFDCNAGTDVGAVYGHHQAAVARISQVRQP